MDTLLQRAEAAGLRMTGHRRLVAEVLEGGGHPDVEAVHAAASARDPGISIATVYRALNLFQEAGLVEKREFGDGRARWEDAAQDHHDHLIDVATGEVIEFVDPEIEELQRRIADRLGYDLVDHRLELFGRRRR
ncbi:MAG: Fur family transcriptional regulator [Hasllibacter sp.]